MYKWSSCGEMGRRKVITNLCPIIPKHISYTNTLFPQRFYTKGEIMLQYLYSFITILTFNLIFFTEFVFCQYIEPQRHDIREFNITEYVDNQQDYTNFRGV